MPRAQATFVDRVSAVVKRIPKGRVASYGLVGEVAGYPRAARHVGRVMRLCSGCPWWRVLAADGRIVIQNPEGRREQLALLASEGVAVVEGKVDYRRHAWKPRGIQARPKPARNAPVAAKKRGARSRERV